MTPSDPRCVRHEKGVDTRSRRSRRSGLARTGPLRRHASCRRRRRPHRVCRRRARRLALHGRWHKDARGFLKRHREVLAGLPLAVFGMGPLTMKESDVAGARKQLDHALGKAKGVEPFAVTVFGGVVDPARLHFPFNRMPASDARDWTRSGPGQTTLPTRLLRATSRRAHERVPV